MIRKHLKTQAAFTYLKLKIKDDTLLCLSNKFMVNYLEFPGSFYTWSQMDGAFNHNILQLQVTTFPIKDQTTAFWVVKVGPDFL